MIDAERERLEAERAAAEAERKRLEDERAQFAAKLATALEDCARAARDLGAIRYEHLRGCLSKYVSTFTYLTTTHSAPLGAPTVGILFDRLHTELELPSVPVGLTQLCLWPHPLAHGSGET